MVVDGFVVGINHRMAGKLGAEAEHQARSCELDGPHGWASTANPGEEWARQESRCGRHNSQEETIRRRPQRRRFVLLRPRLPTNPSNQPTDGGNYNGMIPYLCFLLPFNSIPS